MKYWKCLDFHFLFSQDISLWTDLQPHKKPWLRLHVPSQVWEMHIFNIIILSLSGWWIILGHCQNFLKAKSMQVWINAVICCFHVPILHSLYLLYSNLGGLEAIQGIWGVLSDYLVLVLCNHWLLQSKIMTCWVGESRWHQSRAKTGRNSVSLVLRKKLQYSHLCTGDAQTLQQ